MSVHFIELQDKLKFSPLPRCEKEWDTLNEQIIDTRETDLASR